MLEDERNLILEAKGGKAEAFGQLYDYYLPAIYRFILLRVGQREDAEDLSHQVFLKSWQNISKYSEKGHPFSSWLYQIARNLIIDNYRKNKPVADINEEFVYNNLVFNPNITSIDDKKDIARVMLSVQKLKSIEQEVIIMRFVEDLSIKEISKNINKSEGAIKLIQHRALNKIKELLKEEL